MSPIAHFIYCIVIYSNLYLGGDETSAVDLNVKLSQLSETYNFQFQTNKPILNKSENWFSYLKEVKASKVCLIKTNREDERIFEEVIAYKIAHYFNIEVVKSNGQSDFWFCLGETENGRTSFNLVRKYSDPSSCKKQNIDLSNLRAQAVDHVKKMYELGKACNEEKVTEYFESAINPLIQDTVETTVIPTEKFSNAKKQLIRIYELTGDFNVYRDWNPFDLGEANERKLDSLYSDYLDFRELMFLSIVNN